MTNKKTFEFIDPKYKLGDSIWYIGYKICNETIIRIYPHSIALMEVGAKKIEYMFSNGDCRYEVDIYPSKLHLIEAQIDYWNKLKLEAMNSKFEGNIEGFNQSEDNLDMVYKCIHDNNYCPTCMKKNFSPQGAL